MIVLNPFQVDHLYPKISYLLLTLVVFVHQQAEVMMNAAV